MRHSPADPDAAARRTLARHRAVATGLLLVMTGLILLVRLLPPGLWTDLLDAAARAGLVGGLADWFAVTALFRHPLGLPIPHTAIIPAQKARLGAALGRFVANHVFTTDDVARILGQLDMPAIIQRFLADPATSRPAAEALAGMMPKLLASRGGSIPASASAAGRLAAGSARKRATMPARSSRPMVRRTSASVNTWLATNRPSARPSRTFCAGMIAVCGIGRPSGWRNSAVTANQSAMPPTNPALAAACNTAVAKPGGSA